MKYCYFSDRKLSLNTFNIPGFTIYCKESLFMRVWVSQTCSSTALSALQCTENDFIVYLDYNGYKHESKLSFDVRKVRHYHYFMLLIPARVKCSCNMFIGSSCFSRIWMGGVCVPCDLLSCHGCTCGTTPKAFLHVCRETELQETPSMEMSPSVEARRSRAESRVLFPEPVRPSRPIWETNKQKKISSLLKHLT